MQTNHELIFFLQNHANQNNLIRISQRSEQRTMSGARVPVDADHYYYRRCRKCPTTNVWTVKETRIKNGPFWQYCGQQHADDDQDERDKYVAERMPSCRAAIRRL